MTSISSNPSAILALRVMNEALRNQSDIQSRIATGLNVTGAKDNGAAYAVSQTLKADLASEQGLTRNLVRAASTLDVAAAGTEVIQGLLIQLRELSVAYSDPSLSDSASNALRSELTAGFQQLDKAARGSTFDGVNLLTGKLTPSNTTRMRYALTAGAVTPPEFQTVIASLPHEASLIRSSLTQSQSSVTGVLTPATYGQALAQLSGSNSQTFSFDAGTTPGRLNLFINAYSAPDAVEIWQNGQRRAASGQPYVAGGAPVGAGVPLSGQSVLSFDYDPAAGQTVELRFNENYQTQGTVWDVSGLILQDPAEPVPSGPRAVEQRVETGQLSVTTTTGDPALPATALSPEQSATLLGETFDAVTPETIIHGGSTPGRVMVVFDAFEAADKLEIYQKGVRVAATGQSDPRNGSSVGAGQTLSGVQLLSFDYDPIKGSDLTFVINDGQTTPRSGWAVGAMALLPLSAGLPTHDPKTLKSVSIEPGFAAQTYRYLTSARGDVIDVQTRNLTLKGLGLDAPDWRDPQGLRAMIDVAMTKVSEAASYFGGRSNAVAEMQQALSQRADTLEAAKGNLVDADLAQLSALSLAAGVKSQLATQSLAIAGAQPEILLSLFNPPAKS